MRVLYEILMLPFTLLFWMVDIIFSWFGFLILIIGLTMSYDANKDYTIGKDSNGTVLVEVLEETEKLLGSITSSDTSDTKEDW